MEHAEAIRTKAAEQYLLGELTGGLREQYEDHFFSCQECAEEVEAGVVFLRAAQEVLGSDKSPKIAPLRAEPRIRGWYAYLLRPTLAVAATAILLVIVSYQNVFLIPQMKTEVEQTNTAHTLTSFSLITENSRGGASLTIAVSPTKPFGLYLDIPPGNFVSYVCEIESESGGAPRISLEVSQQEAKETVQLLVPASRLQPGKYLLVVRGLGGSQGTNGEGVEVARYAFTVTFDNEPNR